MRVWTVEIAPKVSSGYFRLVRIFSLKDEAIKFVESRNAKEQIPGWTWETIQCIYLIDSYEVE